jgi:hypothetical protein
MPYRKNLYVEVPEISNKSEEEVAAHRKKLDNIRIRGLECPNPVTSFRQCGLPRKLLQIMDKFGYKKPTPIQVNIHHLEFLIKFTRLKCYQLSWVVATLLALQRLGREKRWRFYCQCLDVSTQL